MTSSQEIVLRPLRLIGTVDVQESLAELTPIQALIDQVKAGQPTQEQADNAQASVTHLTMDLNALKASPPATVTSSKLTTGSAVLLGLGAGLLIGSLVFVAVDHPKQQRRNVRGAG